MLETIKNKANEIFPKIQTHRRHIHQNPELSFEEFETSKFIQNELTKLGIEFKILGNTGVIGLVGKGNKCVALRADIDALPIFEETGLDYKSQNDGVMHACGHDMHTSMLLGAAEILKSIESDLNGCVKLIFQPAEEKLPGGASILIKEGVLENPKVDAIFGQHIYPGDSSGLFATNSGYVMGSADELYWTISGKSTHAAQPHLGYDPILAASQLIVFYQTLMTKYKDPLDAGVLTVGSINGGNATNIIPDKVEMKGTLRSFNLEWREQMHHLLIEKSNELCKLYGCECDLKIIKGYPPVFNNETLTNFSKLSANQVFGTDNVIEFIPKMWGEDFAFYGQVIPASFWFLGIKPLEIENMPALHNSKLSPDEIPMINGMIMLAKVAYDYLNK